MNNINSIYGSIPALITPFKNGDIDWNALKGLIDWQIEQGSHGLVICGTTGESPTITKDEHKELITKSVEYSSGRAPVIAGCGSNSTAGAIALTKQAQDAGADAALIVVPYYNKPSQDGIYHHFKAVHDATNIPIILYNVPGRTIADMSVETTIKLSKLPRIIGIKDASGELARLSEMKSAISEDFIYLSGDDPSADEYIIQGGHGCISVTANVLPSKCAEIYALIQSGNIEDAKRAQKSLMEIHASMFCEPSPAAAKYALSKLERCTNEVRLPLLALSEASHEHINELFEL